MSASRSATTGDAIHAFRSAGLATFLLLANVVGSHAQSEGNGAMDEPVTRPSSAIEREITAPGPAGPLVGTLALPAGGGLADDTPVVLIVPGSGPTDRDGNSPLGIAAAPYRLLAHALADRGIASVRFDKRGMHASQAAVADPNAVTIADYASDVVAWTDAVRELAGDDDRCIVPLGHSEGGLVAMEAARDLDPCGVVLIAAPGRTFGTILREQLAANPANAPILDQADGAIASIERGERVDADELHPGLGPLFDPAVQGFLIDLAGRDPARMAASVSAPTLIIQGGRDLQITEADVRSLDGAAASSELVLLPNMNHVLKNVADDASDNFASYADPDRPLAPNLADTIARFVMRVGTAE